MGISSWLLPISVLSLFVAVLWQLVCNQFGYGISKLRQVGTSSYPPDWSAFLEFLLETSYAQFAAQSEPEAFARTRGNIINSVRFKLLVIGGSGDSEIDLAVQNKMIAIAEQFFSRVESRSKQIAEESSQQDRNDQSNS